MNKRLFVEVLPEYRSEESKLAHNFSRALNKEIKNLRKVKVYDLINTNQETFDFFKNEIIADEIVNTVSEVCELTNSYFAYEALEEQYDQETDWSNKLINDPTTTIKASTLLIFEENTEIQSIKNYYINPLEYKIKDLNKLEYIPNTKMKPMKNYEGFIQMNTEELNEFYATQGLAMEVEDLLFIQDYFKEEGRDPSETELLVLDTYWSDHCRHTTFMSELEEITFDEFKLKSEIEKSFKLYLSDKEALGRNHKAISLMDITAQNGRYAKQILNDQIIEISEEVNACSIKIEVDVDGNKEPWLLMFKNETHNHPTEIEPFGGASTCIGGAIRDPLSGRAYVYQAMRISGSGNVLESIEATHPDKLPQSIISTSAAQGYSHYAKQIGITSSYLKEIYHDSYKAKRMELGAVVGAIRESDLIRETPQDLDCIIMLGGRTGRDGVGGATGSSDVQSLETAETNAAEVQKGNALEERKIIRLFRNPEISRMIKKSNDFGAGGISVAIGELADGLEIDLDKVLLKYEGLNPTEIAISESQERMAVVVDPKDVERFIELATNEGSEAVVVAKVNNSNRLVIKDANGTYVDLKRDFLDSGGITQKVNVKVSYTQNENPFTPKTITKEAIIEEVSHIKNASQAGLAQLFDATDAYVKPLLGKTQLTPNIGSVQKIPLLRGETNTVSVLTHGFIPEVMEYSPYVGGSHSVIESVSKTVALGGDYTKIYLSFQEYFNRLTTPEKWGNVLQTLLGTYSTQRELGLCAIGGKDSMSGTYENLDVVDTLVSFACSPQKADEIITSELKEVNTNLYLLETPMNEDGIVDIATLKKQYEAFGEVKNQILSASTTDDVTVIMSLLKMSFGNKISFEISLEENSLRPGSIIFESKEVLPQFKKIGQTIEGHTLKINEIELDLNEIIEHNTKTLEPIYPSRDLQTIENSPIVSSNGIKPIHKVKNVLIPIFPGTTGEYTLTQMYTNQGANVTQFVFLNDYKALAKAIAETDLIVLPSGSTNGDVPAIASIIVQTLKQEDVKQAIHNHIENGKMILGFGNGYQALVKTGLLPHGKIQTPTLSFAMNQSGRHVSTMVTLNTNETLYSSNSYGRLVGTLNDRNIAARYININPSGSIKNAEALISDNGHVYGRMSQPSTEIITQSLTRGL